MVHGGPVGGPIGWRAQRRGANCVPVRFVGVGALVCCVELHLGMFCAAGSPVAPPRRPCLPTAAEGRRLLTQRAPRGRRPASSGRPMRDRRKLTHASRPSVARRQRRHQPGRRHNKSSALRPTWRPSLELGPWQLARSLGATVGRPARPTRLSRQTASSGR